MIIIKVGYKKTLIPYAEATPQDVMDADKKDIVRE